MRPTFAVNNLLDGIHIPLHLVAEKSLLFGYAHGTEHQTFYLCHDHGIQHEDSHKTFVGYLHLRLQLIGHVQAYHLTGLHVGYFTYFIHTVS